MASTDINSLNLLTATATELQENLSKNAFTSVDLVKCYLAQIEAHNRNGLELRAMISVAPEQLILAKARALDEERAAGKVRSRLHGIPVILKDAIGTDASTGLDTTCGAYAFLGTKSKKNAPMVQQLVDGGVLILGKANMTEFCGLKAEKMTPGYSALGGQTKSVYTEDGLKEGDSPLGHWMPGGSSTGAGQGVAAGFSPISIGTETVGSIVNPANRAGLYAVKLTVGGVSTDGCFRLTEFFDSLGPMGKSAADVATLAELMIKPEVRSKLPEEGYQSALTKSWDGLSIGFVDPEIWDTVSKKDEEPDKGVHQQITDAYKAVKQKIKESGVGVRVVDEWIDLPTYDKLRYKGTSPFRAISDQQERDFCFQQFADSLDNPRVSSLQELVDFNDLHKEKALPEPWNNQKELIDVLKSQGTAEESQEILAIIKRVAKDEGVDLAMEQHGIDLIIAPSDCNLCCLASAAGYPIGVVPLGLLDLNGRPFGITIMAKAYDEAKIFHFMSAFEATFPRIPPPTLLSG